SKDVGGGNLQSPAARLARLLKPYGVKPATIKVPAGSTAKGYHRADFEGAWERYLPPLSPIPCTVVTAVTAVTSRGENRVTTCPKVTTKLVTSEDAVTGFSQGRLRELRQLRPGGDEGREGGRKGLSAASQPCGDGRAGRLVQRPGMGQAR